MKIIRLSLGPIETNCYILYKNKQALVIDPGGFDDILVKTIKKHQLIVETIYITHGHFDHVGGVNKLKALTNAKVYAPKLDQIWFGLTKYNRLGEQILVDQWVSDGDIITLNDTLEFLVIHTPGHTEGSTGLYLAPCFFGGDTIFQRGIGRVDLPFGSFSKIEKSIKMLYEKLPDDTIIYPGHGETTTIEYEKKNNHFVKG